MAVDRLSMQLAAQTVLAFSHCTPVVGQVARIGLAMLAIVREEALAGNEHYWASANPVGVLAAPISVNRVLGLLSHTMNNLDQATAHFEDSLAFCRRAGSRPELAWTCCDYADTLLQRASTGSAQADDRDSAMSLLDESLAISTELGMRPLMERVLSRREILKA